MRKASLPSILKRFFSHAKGNVAIIFSLSAIPLLMAAGAAVDYMRATDTQARMERALDAAALAVGNSTNLSNADMRKLAIRYFRENYPNADEAVDASIKVTVNGDRISLSADAHVPTTLLNIVGYKDIPIHISNEVMRSGNNLEVALALDITGSMGTPGSKIAALKVAAKDLVDLLVSDDQSKYYSKVALAPYSNSVNVGPLADILRGVPQPGTCNHPGCEGFEFNPAFGFKRTFGISTCVTERTGPEAYTDADPRNLPPAKYLLGPHYSQNAGLCPAPEIVPLTSNKTLLKNQIDSFQVSGTTAGHIGASWAWYLLSPNFGSLWPNINSQPANYGTPKVVKAAVLMTDGAFNTMYCKGVVSKDSTASNMTDRINCDATNGTSFQQALKTCDAMKQQGITVYTVGFMIGNEPAAKDVMAKCATSLSHAYNASSGSELKTAFSNIATRLSELRLSK